MLAHSFLCSKLQLYFFLYIYTYHTIFIALKPQYVVVVFKMVYDMSTDYGIRSAGDSSFISLGYVGAPLSFLSILPARNIASLYLRSSPPPLPLPPVADVAAAGMRTHGRGRRPCRPA